MKDFCTCTICGDDFPMGRHALGYTTCLPCGDKQARTVRHTIVPLNKGNYIPVTNLDELKMLNPKRIGG